MKNKKKLLSVLLVFIMMFAIVGCKKESPNSGENPSESSAFKKGTYTAKATGVGGDIEVEVIVSDTEIEAINILNHSETEGIADPAIEQIPNNIITAQGLDIDAISGATVTSDAIMAAVIDALTQAGADIEDLKTKGLEVAVLEDEELETDVVVVGGGIAGLSAAIAAAEDGAKVVLVEKMASVGGASIVSGGEILAGGTEMQADQGIEDTAEALKDYWLEVGEGKINEEIVGFIADNSENTVNWLKDRGVKYKNVTFSYNYPAQDPKRNHAGENDSGADFVTPLYNTAKELGIEIRLETSADSLINEDGVIKGIVATNQGRTVTINANNTILATGGYANNEELMKEYSPDLKAFGTFLGEAHNGDGLIMARDAGAEIVANGGGIANPSDGGATGYADAGGIFLNVTPEGERFANENDYWFKRSAILYHDLGYNYYYGIADSTLENPGLEEAIEDGTVFKADSIEELAELIEMDGAVLADTVSRYNEMCKDKVDKDFGKPEIGLVGSREANIEEAKLLNPIEEGPYYAVLFKTSSVTGTFGGPKTNIDGQVISTTGDIIPGLYAAGEVANGELLYKQYPCSGTSIQMSATMGIQAGKAAAATIE